MTPYICTTCETPFHPRRQWPISLVGALVIAAALMIITSNDRVEKMKAQQRAQMLHEDAQNGNELGTEERRMTAVAGRDIVAASPPTFIPAICILVGIGLTVFGLRPLTRCQSCKSKATVPMESPVGHKISESKRRAADEREGKA